MVEEALKQVTIEDHPVYTDPFIVEVPVGFDDVRIKSHVQSLDLDLLLGIPGGVKVGKTDTKLIQDFENSAEAGKRGGNWYTHKSIEGGTDSLAYGHKLTPKEAESGFVTIGDKLVDYTAGITQEQAQTILDQDANFAKKIAVASLAKVGMEGDSDKVSALTSLIFNVGSGSWAGSKAKKFLESGNMEDFMHQAFSEDAGWVNINGEKSRGLVRRRIAEGELFTRQHRQQVASEATSKGFSFISEAQANELSPALKEATEAAEGIVETQGPKFPSPTRKPQILEDLGPKELRGITPGRKPEFAKLAVSNTEAKTFFEDFMPKFREVKPAFNLLTPIPVQYRAYANHVQGFDGVFDQTQLRDNELQFLIDKSVEGIKLGKSGLAYENTEGAISYGPGADIGYHADVDFNAPVHKAMRLTLGKADIVMDGENVMIADEYGLPMDQGVLKKMGVTEDELRESSILDKYKYIMAADGSQGKAHRFGELFAPQRGTAMSQRYTLGTLEELGLTGDDVKHLMTLEEYEVKNINIGRMNPNNVMTPTPTTITTVAEGQDNIQGGAGEDILDTAVSAAGTVAEVISPGADIRDMVRESGELFSSIKEGRVDDAAIDFLEMIAGALGIVIPGSQKIKAGGKAVGAAIDEVIAAAKKVDGPARERVNEIIRRPTGRTREEVANRGGPRSKNVGDKVGRILDEHNIEWEHADNGGITAIEYWTKAGGVEGSTKKYFGPNTRLGTIRDWLGY